MKRLKILIALLFLGVVGFSQYEETKEEIRQLIPDQKKGQVSPNDVYSGFDKTLDKVGYDLDINLGDNIFGEDKELQYTIIDGYYLSKTGSLVANSSYEIRVFNSEKYDKFKYDVLANGSMAVVSFFEDSNLLTLKEIIETQAVGYTRTIGEVKAKENYNYMAISVNINDAAFAKVWRSDNYSNFTNLLGSATIIDNCNVPTVIRDGEYMVANGAIGDNSYYNINMYDVSEFNYVRIKGKYYGSIAVFAYCLDVNANYLFEVGKTASLSDGVNVIDTIIDVKSNYISVVEHISYDIDLYSVSNTEINDRIRGCSEFEIDGIGDSMTAFGKWQSGLFTLLGGGYKINNYGVGGESELDIAARIGAIPAILKNDVTIPSSTDPVVVGDLTDSGIISSADSLINIRLLLQGSRGVNPVYIDGVECNLIWTGSSYDDNNGTWTINRVEEGDERVLYSGTSLQFDMQSTQRQNRIEIIWVGTNATWSDQTDLIDRIESIVEFAGSTRYIIIGIHYHSGYVISDFEELENKYINAFGAKYINIRKYMVENALIDAGITATTQDSIDINNGYPPSSLRSDDIHFNDSGFELVSEQIYSKGKLLGYW